MTLEAFLAGNCEATKAKYAAELEHAGSAWRRPLDLWYAESLVHFGLLERLVKHLPRPRRGSRIWFRRPPESKATRNGADRNALDNSASTRNSK
jgi:hypothetical protein